MEKGLTIGCIIFGILLNAQGARCISCFHCNGAEHVSDCLEDVNAVRLCPPQEFQTCYMEKRINLETGRNQYFAGCQNIKLCHLDSCQKAVFGDAHSRAVANFLQLPVCTECCYKSNCNYELCGAKLSEIPLNITQCFNCKDMHDASICNQTVTCDLKINNCLVMKKPDGKFDLKCMNKHQCGILLQEYKKLDPEDVTNETRCCDTHLCNENPLIPKLDTESILQNFSCPPNLVHPTTTKSPAPQTNAPKTNAPSTATQTTAQTTSTTTPTTTTSTPTSTTIATMTTTTTTANTPTTRPTTQDLSTNAPSTASPPQTISSTTTTTTTAAPTTTTKASTPTTTTATVVASTAPPPKTLPPVTTSCAVCAGPAFLCEKLFAPTPCPAPENYCINSVINHKDGTRTVDRKCGDFDTCYREWFQGSSDDDKCRKFNEDEEQRLDFQCTFCCVTDDCNIPLRPDAASLYKPA